MGMKLNLCCGDQILDGWLNLDPRIEVDSRIMFWQWGSPLPCPADVVYVSYGFMYTEKQNYQKLLKQIYDTLDIGGILIIKEDDNTKRIWRNPGSKHSTGTIKSNSSPEEMMEFMLLTGFLVQKGCPEEYTYITDTHIKARNKSYILTGVKK